MYEGFCSKVSHILDKEIYSSLFENIKLEICMYTIQPRRIWALQRKRQTWNMYVHYSTETNVSPTAKKYPDNFPRRVHVFLLF